MTDAKAATPKAKKASKPKAAPSHPPTAAMIKAAVKALKERNGSSLPAIKKYIAANYKVDIVKLAPFIKKALKSLVEKKKLQIGSILSIYGTMNHGLLLWWL